MDDDAMEMQLLLMVMGPTNEETLEECLGGIIPHNTHYLMVYDLEGRATQTLTNEIEDYLEPSMLGCFTSPWRCSQRGTRKRGKSWGDKWRNLVKACRTKVGSKMKVNKLQKATELIVQRFKRQILDIARRMIIIR